MSFLVRGSLNGLLFVHQLTLWTGVIQLESIVCDHITLEILKSQNCKQKIKNEY